MTRTRRHAALILVLAAAVPRAGAQPAAASTRLDLVDPALTLTPGGRTAACDALAFTADGADLLAAGEDKVVHTWAVGPDGLRYGTPLRWNTFREVRGSIYALAQSADGREVAVGGYGRLDSDVAVLDRATGRITHALSPADFDRGVGYARHASTVWALAFDPVRDQLAIGQEDGSVWVWTYRAHTVTLAADRVPAAAVPEAARTPAQDDAFRLARVVGVGFLQDGRVWFARRDGSVNAVNPTGGQATNLFKFGNAPVGKVYPSRDGRRVAATPYGETVRDGSRVEVWSIGGRRVASFPFPFGQYPAALDLDAARDRLAVALRTPTDAARRKVFYEPPGEVRVYDLAKAAEIARHRFPAPPEAVALHPDGRRVAVAGGFDHETTLWEIRGGGLAPVGEPSVGVGTALWAVGLSKDGRVLSVKDRPNPTPPQYPNDRADPKAPWRAFDLTARRWVPKAPPPAVVPLTAANGWRVELPTAGSDTASWRVRRDSPPQNHELPLTATDGRPICYTFFPPEPGSEVTRVAVGHYWGFSVFEFSTVEPPRRVHRGTGHTGYVSAVVVTPDGKRVVTASRDQTVCLWDLTPWPNGSELGASFAAKGGKVTVGAVAPGSPAWEIGLETGEVVTKANRGNTPKWADAAGPILNLLRGRPDEGGPTPGEELALLVARGSVEVGMKTRMYRRPVARFFPTRNNDWVIYRYQDYAYDCGTTGDSYVGFLLGGRRAVDTPEFVPAERFRKELRRPGVIADFLASQVREPKPFLREYMPPEVILETPVAQAPNAAVAIDITVIPARNKANKPEVLRKVEVWVDDEVLLKTWAVGGPGARPVPGALAADADGVARVRLDIPPTVLRSGVNRVKVVAYALARGEAVLPVDYTPPARRTGTLRALIVGVNKYSQAFLKNLDGSVPDTELIRDVVGRLADGKAFAEKADVEHLPDEQATKAAILDRLDALAKRSGPDDVVVIYLAGHGDRKGTGAAARGPADAPPGTWFFVPYTTDAQLRDAIAAPDLYGRLAPMNGRKLVLLDSCHSGAALLADPARDLRPDGKGPVVIAAAAGDQTGGEGMVRITRDGAVTEETHGFFTAAVYHGLGPKSADADADGDGFVTLDELYRYASRQVAKYADPLGARGEVDGEVQTVQMAPYPVRNVGFRGLTKPRK